MTRKYTSMLLDIVEDGVMDPKDALLMCLSYMSEADVQDMCEYNDIFSDGDEERLEHNEKA